MASQGLLQCAGITKIVGGEYTNSRGVQPGKFRVRASPQDNFLKFVGPATLVYGSNQLTFQNCATGPKLLRVWQGRTPYLWSITMYDKRWLWRYPRITGRYNVYECGGALVQSTKKSLTELLTLCLGALDEGQFDLRDVPSVYPSVNWSNAYAARELEWLCDLAGLVICLKLDGTIVIERIGSGADLPSGFRRVTPIWRYNQSIMPSKVQVSAGLTRFQGKWRLKAVGLEPNGMIRPIDDLSYKPAGGWESQWYTTFSGVASSVRHLAFQTMWRWYQLDYQIAGEPIDSLSQVTMLEHLAEQHNDHLGIPRCLDPVVEGNFWPQVDLKPTTADGTRYSGPIIVKPHLHLIEFEYPVIRWDSSLRYPLPATLDLIVAYNLTNAQTNIFEKSVPNAIHATKPRVEKRSYLTRTKVNDVAYGGGSSDNLSDVQAEANGYLDAIVPTYVDIEAYDVIYGGIMPVEVSGIVAQVRFRWGNERVATTRAGRMHEFDVAVSGHQERRRQERLGQIAEKVLDG